MRRLILTCVLLVLVAGVAAADEIYIPANTPSTGSGNSWPFNTQFGTEWKYQLVFTAQQLGGQPLRITDIAFAPTSSGTFTAATLEVRMSHCTVAASSTFANNLPNPQTVLMAKNFSWVATQAQWSPIGLQNAFSFNGTDSLTIELRYIGGNKGSYGGVCKYDSNNHPRCYDRNPGSWSATSGSFDNHGLKIRITVQAVSLVISGNPTPGGTINLALTAGGDAGKRYQMASSFGPGPTPIGSRSLGLTVDDLMVLTLNNYLPGMFVSYAGTLDASGTANGMIRLPNIPLLKGVRFYTAFVTLDTSAPLGISLISPTEPISIK